MKDVRIKADFCIVTRC